MGDVCAKILNVLPKCSHELRSIDKNRVYAPKVYALLEFPDYFDYSVSIWQRIQIKMFLMTNFVRHPVISCLRPNIYLNILNSVSFNESYLLNVVSNNCLLDSNTVRTHTHTYTHISLR